MRVKLLVSISGSRDGMDWPPKGTEIDLPDAEAVHMIEGRMAEAVKATKAETATVAPAAETADVKPAKRAARKSA